MKWDLTTSISILLYASHRPHSGGNCYFLELRAWDRERERSRSSTSLSFFRDHRRLWKIFPVQFKIDGCIIQLKLYVIISRCKSNVRSIFLLRLNKQNERYPQEFSNTAPSTASLASPGALSYHGPPHMRPQSPTTSPGAQESACDTYFECREIARCLAAFGAISDAARILMFDLYLGAAHCFFFLLLSRPTFFPIVRNN